MPNPVKWVNIEVMIISTMEEEEVSKVEVKEPIEEENVATSTN